MLRRFQKRAIMSKIVSTKTVRLIETSWARTALRYMAEYLPGVLLDMAETEPEELLKDIEKQVGNAMDWEQTLLKKGVAPDVAREMATQQLKPSWQSENPEQIEVSEMQIQQIIDKLIRSATTTK